MGEVDFKNALLAGDPADAEEETREVPSHAGTIVVRGLTRKEVLTFKGAHDRNEIDVAEYERQMIAAAMITPKMTIAEVEKWQEIDKAGGTMGKVADAIAELSKMQEGADKSGVPSPRRSRKRS